MTPTCPEPDCALLATQVTTRDLDDHIHELTAVCASGHLWTTKWFAQEASD